MAVIDVGPVSLLIDRVKIGEATDGQYRLSNGMTRVETNDGIALTNGKNVADITFKTVMPRAGMKAKLEQAVLTKKTMKAQFAIGGVFHEVEGKLSGMTIDWNHASGTCTGDFSFMGGEPVILG